VDWTDIQCLECRLTGQRATSLFYYLDNFRTALRCIADRYYDLLSAGERQFIDQLERLPQSAQALLVRLIMRKGELFRESRIVYAEIGDIAIAAAPLIELGWLDANPELTLDELFGMATRPELQQMFIELRAGGSKSAALESLRDTHPGSRNYGSWSGRAERAYRVLVAALCAHFRILFFGNFRQDWSEFVLAELEIFKYESVAISAQSRAFQTRAEIEQFYLLYDCRQQLAAGEDLGQIMALIPQQPLANEWLESRRAKLLFQVARDYERGQQPLEALNAYARCGFPGARLKRLRVMERCGDYGAALQLAQAAAAQPEDEAERQQLPRVLTRISRRLALPSTQSARAAKPERMDVSLPPPEPPMSVERALLAHLTRPEAPIYYVENALINSLFGLLCWEAIFAPISGAFFHQFHSGPADLLSPTFYRRRQSLFQRCLLRLEDGSYQACIRQVFEAKQGIQSPFVFWGALSVPLLDTALQCIPALHLRRYFERLLLDLRQNRAGLPDLIQFWPQERRYRMIEVKGPGDRLQDNQRRWIDYCQSAEIPVAVCHVSWARAAA
jgi:VRR-NUC domain/Fanconi anemia-associated nuclease SAP domain